MSELAALIAEAPAVGWLALACLLLAGEAAFGRARLTGPALAALAPTGMAAAHAPGGALAQGLGFAGLAVALGVFGAVRRRASRAARRPPAHGLPTPTRAAKPPGRDERSRRQRPRWTPPRPASASPREATGRRRPRIAAGSAARAPAVIGARGRTLGEFCNGVGRVWIDRAEWAAELISGEALAPDHDVEVVGVAGGVRLRVRALA